MKCWPRTAILAKYQQEKENNNDIITVPKLDVDAEESPYFSDEDNSVGME